MCRNWVSVKHGPTVAAALERGGVARRAPSWPWRWRLPLSRRFRPPGSTRPGPSRVGRRPVRLARSLSFRVPAGAWLPAQLAAVSVVRALRGPGPFLGSDAVAVSPDGKNLYVASERSQAIAVFRRDQATGELTQGLGPAGCVAADGAEGCGSAVGLAGPNSVAVSPDGTSVYATSAAGSSLAIFRRSRDTGSLTQLPGTAGCVAAIARPGSASARGLIGPAGVAVSPDGKNLYAGAFFGDAVVAFGRDGSTGALTQLPRTSGCIAVAIPGCARGVAMGSPEGLAVSHDGKNVYVAAALSDAVDVLSHDPATGALTQATDGTGCLVSTPQRGCGTARALRAVNAVAVSPDDRSVYLTAAISQSVAILARASGAGGELTQQAGSSGCVQIVQAEGCALGRPMLVPEGLAIAPDGCQRLCSGVRIGHARRLRPSRHHGCPHAEAGRAGMFRQHSSAWVHTRTRRAARGQLRGGEP